MITSTNKEFLYAIGGHGANNKAIYKFSCNGDIKTCKWTKTNTELKYGRYRFVAMPLPNTLAEKLCKRIRNEIKDSNAFSRFNIFYT